MVDSGPGMPFLPTRWEFTHKNKTELLQGIVSRMKLPVTVNLLFKSENEFESRSQIVSSFQGLFLTSTPSVCIAESTPPPFLRVVFVTLANVEIFCSPSKYGGRLVRDW